MLIFQMNKSSILTDAIAYIQELQEQERSLMEETSQLGNMEDPTDHESCQTTNHDKVEYDEDMLRIKDKARCAADNIQVSKDLYEIMNSAYSRQMNEVITDCVGESIRSGRDNTGYKYYM